MPEYEGEEYDVLLRFVAAQGEALKNKKTDDDEDGKEEESVKTRRVWYMPWKVVKVNKKAAKVCEEIARYPLFDPVSTTLGRCQHLSASTRWCFPSE